MKSFVLSGVAFFCIFVYGASAQEVYQDLKEIVTAEVTGIVSSKEHEIVGTDTLANVQQIKAKLTSGSAIGRTVTFENEMVTL